MQETIDLTQHMSSQGAGGDMGQIHEEEDDQHRVAEVLHYIISYAVNVKIDHIIKIMLEHHNTDTRQGSVQLPQQTLDIVNSQAKD